MRKSGTSVLLLALLAIPWESRAQSQDASTQQKRNQRLLVVVTDENTVVISSAQVVLEESGTRAVSKNETDYAGRCEFKDLAPGIYRIRAEKEGFYVVVKDAVQVGETERVDITLNHQKEYFESVNVVYSPPAIDPKKTTSSESLTSREIIGLPYSVTRDIRYALPLLPGVVQDAFGQVHMDGSSTRQIFDQLDGFNITDPVDGLFNMRVSVDALRSVEVQTSRYPVEYGKASGGVLSLTTGMGDDHFRISGTNFLPSLRNRKGIHLNSWTPRLIFSGPLRKGKAWFLDAPEGGYDLNIVEELPRGADRARNWRYSNLAKAQVNLTQGNILSGSFLVNRFRSPHAGLSRFNPLESTVNVRDAAYLFTVKDLAYFSNGLLLEIGLGVSQFSDAFRPQGDLPYVINPQGARGNFFESARRDAGRVQGIANLVLPPLEWRGRHEFKVGTDIDRISYRQLFDRRSISILRENGTLSRQISFFGNRTFARNNVETSGYIEDRWSVSPRLLLETGLRLDRDDVVRRVLASPRLALSYLLARDGDTKISGGIGTYYDASSLDFITRPLTGQRMDFFYDSTGLALARPPIETLFHVDDHHLREPRFLNWSIGLERKLPAFTYLRVDFVQKRGRHGWAFINHGSAQPNQLSGAFNLQNERRDRYDALAVTLRRSFKAGHLLFASYTRSAARSNAVLNFNLENPLFSQQAGGPLPWDGPNRVLSWGLLPLKKGYDLSYSLDWRDGFPFSLFNQDQQLVGSPGSRRFPVFFSLNMGLERRFHILGFEWAVRGELDDITDRPNPTAVNSNVDSPEFLTFGGLRRRALTARMRFLGRK
jgi:hypothetical protein